MNTNNKSKILILSNHHSYTYNFRKEIIQELLEKGYDVYLSLPFGEKVKQLQDMGCHFTESPLDRRGMNPLKDFKLLKFYFKHMKKIKPDVVLSYTIKPNIYGGFVCRVLKIPFIPNVTGLGTAVGNKSVLQTILLSLYKSAFKNASCVFFQNESNKDFFVKSGVTLKRVKVIPGSGINTTEFPYQDYPSENTTLKFLFVGRIMRDKGIEELIEAAKKISDLYKNVQFDAIGFCEDDYKKKVDSQQSKNIINFHGVKDNVKKYLKECSAVIHPTYHEGMSNVLLEAAATGRPILASNIPGCKEIFDDGISGFGFEPRNINSLIQAILRFIELSNKERMIMGLAGRKKVEKEFDRVFIVKEYLTEVQLILESE